jgi:excisionase family DNA binding protein
MPAKTAPNAIPEARLWSAQQAAGYLGVPVGWVRDAARRNRLPHLRVGKHLRFLQADLDAWIAGQRVPARP